MTKREKLDKKLDFYLSRIVVAIAIIALIVKLSSLPAGLRGLIVVFILMLPRYSWILLLPIIILVVNISMRIIWFVLGGKLFEDN